MTDRAASTANRGTADRGTADRGGAERGGTPARLAAGAALAVATVLALPAALTAQQTGAQQATRQQATQQQAAQQQAAPQAGVPQLGVPQLGVPQLGVPQAGQTAPGAGVGLVPTAPPQTGGVRLTFGIDTRLDSSSNPGLDADGGSARTELDTTLSLGYLTETRLSRLAFDASGRLRAQTGADEDSSDGFTDPALRLSYARAGAAASFDAEAFLLQTDLASDAALDDFDSTSGTQRDIGGSLALQWGNDARVGYGLTAAYTDSDFQDGATDPDRTRLTLGAEMRLDLTEAAQLTLALTRLRFDEAGAAARETTALNAALEIARPRGPLSFGLSVEDTPDGTRTGLTFGRQIALPGGALNARIGLVRGVSGDIGVTGGLTYARSLPQGDITAAISRDITSGAEDDSERRVTRANLGLTRVLTPRTNLSLGLGLAESRTTGDGGDESTLNANAEATLNYALTPDWDLNAGIRYRLRETEDPLTGSETARDTSVFLGLSRGFEVRF